MDARFAARKSMFKKSVDSTSSRRRRAAGAVRIRKARREDHLAKRRAAAAATMRGLRAASEAAVGSVPATLDNLAYMVEGVKSAAPDRQTECTRMFRKLLSVEEAPPVEEVLHTGVLRLFVDFLQRDDVAELQFEACWVVTNIASTDYTSAVVDHGAVPWLVRLLMSENAEVREQAGWAIGNIAGDGATLRDTVLRVDGAMDNLLKNIEHPASPSLLRNAVWTLSNLCRGKPQPKLEFIRPALPALAYLLTLEDKEVLADAGWALSYITDGKNNRIEAVLDEGILPSLLHLLEHEASSVVLPMLRTVGNLVSGSDLQTQTVLDSGVLPLLNALLANERKSLRKEACWTLSNIAAGTPRQVAQLLAEDDILRLLIQMQQHGEWEVAREATWAISNLCTSSDEGQVQRLFQFGCVESLCSILKTADAKLTMVALDALDHVLKTGDAIAKRHGVDNAYADAVEDCDGLDALEDAQRHDSDKVFDKVQAMIRAYWDEDTMDAPDATPTATPTKMHGSPAVASPFGTPSFSSPRVAWGGSDEAVPAGGQASRFSFRGWA